MSRPLLFTTIGAAALALGLSACDQQQTSENTGNSSTPTQQGAVPPADDTGSTPMAPDSTEPQATEPGAGGSDEPDTMQPGTSQ